MNSKSEATEAIEHAQHDLDEALSRLAKVPAIDTDRLAYAAHALNNYLMVVSTISSVLRRSLGKEPGAEAQNRLDSLHHATMLMKAAVRQLAVSAENGQPKLLFFECSLKRIAAAGCDTYEPIAAAKNIEIIREFASDTIAVWTDQVAFGAVVDNVLSNAVKYSSTGGVVRVRVYEEDSRGVLAVSDSGPGIRSDEASRLYSRGGRLSSVPTAGEASTGYGLAIAKDLMDSLHGKIWHVNNEGGGATFFLSLPMRPD